MQTIVSPQYDIAHNIYSATPAKRFEQMFDRPNNRYLLECVVEAASEVIYAPSESGVDHLQQRLWP